jgi:hypothetical protein
MEMGFNHWFGRGARLVLGGPYKHNRRTAAARELNQPPGGLASSGPGLRGPWGAFTKSYEAGTHIVVFVGRAAGVEKSSIGVEKECLHSLRHC